jgi:hypothetical protein
VYVRWIVRGHKNAQADVTFHDAYLVESYRDEQGSPRQRTIAYLGNVREIRETFPIIERELFLLRAEFILEDIAEVSPADQKHVLNILQEKVPPSTEDEVMDGFVNTLQWYIRWWRENGTVPDTEEMLDMIERAKDLPDQSLDNYLS